MKEYTLTTEKKDLIKDIRTESEGVYIKEYNVLDEFVNRSIVWSRLNEENI